jgi:hypothetical protein
LNAHQRGTGSASKICKKTAAGEGIVGRKIAFAKPPIKKYAVHNFFHGHFEHMQQDPFLIRPAASPVETKKIVVQRVFTGNASYPPIQPPQ